jgi:hypothetical protein
VVPPYLELGNLRLILLDQRSRIDHLCLLCIENDPLDAGREAKSGLGFSDGGLGRVDGADHGDACVSR